jgi:hypothetical protein
VNSGSMPRVSYNVQGDSRKIQRIDVRRNCLSFLDRNESRVSLELGSPIEVIEILPVSFGWGHRRGLTLLSYATTQSIEDGELVCCAWVADAKILSGQLGPIPSGKLAYTVCFAILFAFSITGTIQDWRSAHRTTIRSDH